MTTLEEVAAALYRLPPKEFTPRRNALAKQLRDQDRALADDVASLPKPVVAAWAVDVFAHESADQLADLLDLGAQLREAQESLSGERMKALTAQAHTVVQRVVGDVARVARDAGTGLTDSVLGQVEQTLRAAMADPAAGDAARAGLLAKPLEAGGFGSVDLTGAVVGTPQRAPARPRKRVEKRDDSGERDELRRRAQEAVEAAAHRVHQAQDELRAHEGELSTAEQEREAAARRITELRAELAREEQVQAAAQGRVRAASKAKEKAEKRVHAAERAADQAREARHQAG